jgi:protoporphyrinogen/coproporphyrinogen III oxidase
MSRVVIVGGGISGLSAAYYLAKLGIGVKLVERQPRLGGVIRTDGVHGCVLEAGPDSFISQKPWAFELIRSLGLGDELIGSNDHLRATYVVKHRRLVRLPDGLMLMIPTKVLPMLSSPLLGWGTKLRMGLEWLRRPEQGEPGDESVAHFVGAHYGREAVEYLAEPLLAGIYGGDPETLSVQSVLPRFAELERKYGSLTRGVLRERGKVKRQAKGVPLFQTLKGGLSQLVEALEAQTRPAPEILHGTADALAREAGTYRVRVNGDWIEADHVVLACQAYEAAALLGAVDCELARPLAAIPYSNAITVSVGYLRKEFTHPLNGFGFLVPKKERRLLMACTWIGTKFSHRVPDSKAVLRCFVGGEDASALALSDQELETQILEELADLMGVKGTPAFVQIARWPRSMAQYAVGHAARVAGIEARLAKLPGLHLAGNAYHGIGIPDCVRMGREAAEAIGRPAR